MRKSYAFLISLAAIILDQLSKWAVSAFFARPSPGLVDWYLNPPPKLPFAEYIATPFFNLVMVWNRGISFGMFNHGPSNAGGSDFNYGPILLILLSFTITGVFVFILLRGPAALWQNLGIALIIGGALGNVIDRLRFGAVIDFLDFHIAEHHWPAFNVADSCVCVGVTILVIRGLFFEKNLPARA